MLASKSFSYLDFLCYFSSNVLIQHVRMRKITANSQFFKLKHKAKIINSQNQQQRVKARKPQAQSSFQSGLSWRITGESAQCLIHLLDMFRFRWCVIKGAPFGACQDGVWARQAVDLDPGDWGLRPAWSQTFGQSAEFWSLVWLRLTKKPQTMC